jgi:hypothetical protein
VISVAVVIPTRDRPDRLGRCLGHLERARHPLAFPVHVGDSSTSEEQRSRVAEVCAPYDFVRLHHHDGASVAAGRNFCSRIADDAEPLVNVDDDVYVCARAPLLPLR